MSDGDSGRVTLRMASSRASAGMEGLRRRRASPRRRLRSTSWKDSRSAAGSSGAMSGPKTEV